jgi:YegS/Rv2252/BmrU family lipid kinase
MASVRRFCLIVNPNAGGGRTAKALPEVEAALRQHGLDYRVELTTSIDHAQDLAKAAAERDEVAVSYGGDGLAGAVAHALRGTDGVLGVLPGGRGNDFARKLGIPREPLPAAEVLAHADPRTVDVAEVDGRTFLGIASYGFDSDCQDLANATKVVRGQAVYAYSALRTLAAWKAVDLTFTADGGAPRTVSGYAVAACNSGVFGGGMALAPDADLADGLLDVVVTSDASKLHFLRGLPKVFKGTHLADPNIELFRAAELHVDAERPFAIYADGDPIGMTPATIRAVPQALRVLVPRREARRRVRGRPRGRRALAPHRSRRHEPARQGAAARRARRHRRAGRPAQPAARRSSRPRTARPHRSDGRVDPRARRREARAQPRRSEHGRRRGQRAAAGPRRHRACSRSTSSGSAQVVDQLHPRALLLANLFRDQLDRYGELETIADRWAELVARAQGTALVLNADDPTIADLGRARPEVVYFGVEDDAGRPPGLPHASDAKHCRQCGRPYVYDAVLLGHLGHYHCPTGDSTRPTPAVAAEDVELEGVRAARFTLRTPQGAAT